MNTTAIEFYGRPGRLTKPGKYRTRLARLPRSVGALASVVQGLAIHQFVASDFYGVSIPKRRLHESHIRRLAPLLDRAGGHDGRTLAESRPANRRVVGVCHHFALLFGAMLRATGTPARARWGFGSYFNRGFFEDHVLCEYWDSRAGRWIRADAQLDPVWQMRLNVGFDPLDVPSESFVIAADAWQSYRAGQADPERFGIFKGNQRGLWFMACNLIKDVAALNHVEMLPWDTWGAMPAPDETIETGQLAFFDRLAELTREPDTTFADVRQLYEADERVRVPARVYNAVTERMEKV